MAPEQARGGVVTRRRRMGGAWAGRCTRAATGVPPHPEVRPVRALRPRLHAALAEVIDACLSRPGRTGPGSSRCTTGWGQSSSSRPTRRYAASGARRQQAGRGEHVVAVDHDPRAARAAASRPRRSPMLPARTRSATPGRPWRSTPPGADEQVDLAQVLAGALDDPALGADHDLLRPACRRSARPTAARAIASSSSRSASVSGRKPGVVVPALGAPRRGRRSSAASTVETADQRMPRSPSTVRVTGVVATTSRASSRPPGRARPPSARRWWRRRRRRPRRRRRRVSSPASSSTPVSTTSGVAPRTIAVKSARAAEVLAADHVGQEHLADRRAGRSGASTPIAARRCRRRRAGTSARIAATSSRASTLPATTTGPVQPPAPARAPRRRSTSALPPSVPPVSSTTSGAVVR